MQPSRSSSPLLAALASVWLAAPASASPAIPAAPGLYHADWLDENDRSAEAEPPELRLLSYFFTRGSFTNQLADPAGLKGVSLGPIGIGANIGSATRVGEGTEAFYVESRWIPVLTYSPRFADDLAAFRAQFEIDFMWGQAANQLQHNQGGGFNADQVNIQTKNVNVAIYPTRNPRQLAIILGTQPVYDSIFDPTITNLGDIVRTGYKLMYFGSDATGLSIYGNWNGLWKGSILPMGAAQPDKATLGDSRFSFVYLLTADYAFPVTPVTMLGATFWHLQDDTKGAAYAYEGLVPSGPASSSLPPYTGVARMKLDAPKGNVEFLGLNFAHDVNFRRSDFGASGFVMLNVGGYETTRAESENLPRVDILGAAANLELLYNWGKTNADLITLEGLYTTGDSNLSDGEYTGVFTMNQYGLPGAVWFNHKTLILFPFTQTVSNYTGAVVDISNQGFGLVAAIASASYDLIPDRLNLKIGAAYAQSAVAPPKTNEGVPRGKSIGFEVNAELKYNIRYLMTVGLHVGYLSLGNFYDGNAQLMSDPWAAFTTFTWYAF